MAKSNKETIKSFDFKPGRHLARKYEIIRLLGSGWEGEVYLLRELSTGIERAAKFFFPERNPRNKSINFYAKKLHKLRDCPALVRYHTQETAQIQGHDISFLISDFVEGQILTDFLKEQPAKKLDLFQALHLLYSLAVAIEDIHRLKDYHGDLHPGNVIVRRYGLGFQVKLLDFFHWGSPKPQNLRDDIVEMIKIFYDVLGGAKRYAKQPQEVKEICCGLKRTLILKKFKTISHLRAHLENMPWQ
jgi:tRNA A-37 threonylcarbamoyl transferase component Bud32